MILEVQQSESEAIRFGHATGIDWLRLGIDYAKNGTHHAFEASITTPDGSTYDAVQFGRGRYASVLLGSFSLARQVIPKLEQTIGLDAGGPEYTAGQRSVGWPDHNNFYQGGVGSLPSNSVLDRRWYQTREAWRNTKFYTDVDYLQRSISDTLDSLRDPNGLVDLRLVLQTVVVANIFKQQLGYDISTVDAATVAHSNLIQESDMLSRMLRGFKWDPKHGKKTQVYHLAKAKTSDILDKVFESSENTIINKLLDIHEGSKSAAKSNLMEMLTAARGMAGAVMWGINDALIDGKNQNLTEDNLNALVKQSILKYPGASITSRSPKEPVELVLPSDTKDKIKSVKVGAGGRFILNSMLWGRTKGKEEQYGLSRVFGVGKRSCPGRHTSEELMPELFKQLLTHYTIQLEAPIKLASHANSLSPKPKAMARVTPKVASFIY